MIRNSGSWKLELEKVIASSRVSEWKYAGSGRSGKGERERDFVCSGFQVGRLENLLQPKKK